MTKQQTFDIVKTHLLEQQKQKAMENNCCCYRTSNGLKCAVGCLIPDELYSHTFEGWSIDPRKRTHGLGSLMLTLGHDLELLKDLQACHDCDPVELWPIRLRTIANDHGLTME